MAADLVTALRDARACVCCRWRPTEPAGFSGLDAVREWIRADRATLISGVAELGTADGPVGPDSPDSSDAALGAAEDLVALLVRFGYRDDAVSVARSCLSACDGAPPVAKGRARLLLGRALDGAGDQAEALPVLLLALADFTEHDERAPAARASFELAGVLLALGDPDQALIHADLAADGFRRLEDALNEAHSVALQARVLKALGSDPESVDAGWDAAERLAALEAPRCEANVLFRTGMTLLTRMRTPEEAAEAFRPCARRRSEIGDQQGAANALRLLGTSLHLSGDMERAERVLRRAADTAKAAGDTAGLAASRRHLASVLNATGRHRDAAVLARSAADHFAITARPQAEGQALTVLALAQAGTGHLPSAISTVQRAVTVLARSGSRSDTATAYAILGTLSVNMGRYTGGVHALKEALRLFLADGDAGHAGQVRESLAEAEAVQRTRSARPLTWR